MIAEITNNYGNIRASKSFKWLGQIGEYKGFCRFESIDYGFRALYMLINRYVTYYRLTDVPSIIKRYAPPSENRTVEYISHVIDFLYKAGYSCSCLKSHDERIPFICSAIVLQECGKQIEPVRFKNALAL